MMFCQKFLIHFLYQIHIKTNKKYIQQKVNPQFTQQDSNTMMI